MPQTLTVVEHPVLADRLTVMRDRDTRHGDFRQALFEAAAIMAVEVARELPVKEVEIETPLEPTTGLRLRDEVAVVPVLRAGLGMVEGFLRLLPDARVGHVGIYRDEEEHVPIDYYERLPRGLPERPRVRARPDARHRRQRGARPAPLKRAGAKQLELVCLVAAPAGDRGGAGGAPRRPDLDRGGRPRARRERLHPARVGRRRRPGVRHGLIGARPVEPLVVAAVLVGGQAIEQHATLRSTSSVSRCSARRKRSLTACSRKASSGCQ